MAQRTLLIGLYVGGAVAAVAIAVGAMALTRSAPAPAAVVAPAAVAVPQRPTPEPAAGAPLTTHTPEVASNGHLTIRLLGAQPGR